MRGKVSRCSMPPSDRGITPAYAGKSNFLRLCQRLHLGSPPRMRGKGVLDFYSIGFGGITPAYAGKSVLDEHPLLAVWDHPRVCGEKVDAGKTTIYQRGSPPRMRGKVNVIELNEGRKGITPAYAGKSTHQPPELQQ